MVSALIPVFLFSLAMCGTPGPNNILLAASGARFGYRRTIPLQVGVVLGIVSQLMLSAFGLGLLFERYPILQRLLRVFGSGYLLYLAVKVAIQSDFTQGKERSEKPLGLLHGLSFQYLNPKAYLATITAISVYSRPGVLYIHSIIPILVIFAVVASLCNSLWSSLGAFMGRLAYNSGRARGIRMVLGLLIVTSMMFIWR